MGQTSSRSERSRDRRGYVRSKKGVRYDAHGGVVSCIFCNIANNTKRITKVFYEDEDYCVFESRTVYASQHLLVIPKRHVQNVRVLKAQDVPMLQRMHELGQQVMRDNFGDDGQHVFHFHNPPFNSIDHLHLHCFRLPFRNCIRSLQNNDTFCWTSDIEDVVKLASSKL